MATYIAFILILLLPVPALAQGLSRIDVSAASMRTLPDGTLLAEGGVVVEGEGVTVRADSLAYDPGSDFLRLTGNVVMEETGGGSAFTGDNLSLNLSDLTGGISRGQIIIVPNGFRVRGEDIKRTGPEEYSIRKGVFTSCPGDCPDWSFTASRIRVRKEGYLEARHAAFRILDVPVFYTPYLLYPVTTDRQTGVLFPELRLSDETGLESSWPVFITLGPHADATVTPRTFSRDATGFDLEARYRLGLGGGGDLYGFAMGGDENDRWYYAGEHSNALSPGHWLRARWYDAGRPDAPSLFGSSFQERYPGSAFRHGSLEGDLGPVGYLVQSSSLLPLAVQSRAGLPGSDLKRRSAAVELGPVDIGPLWAGVGALQTRFENGESRTLVEPAAALVLKGPGRLGGVFHARSLVVEEDDGTLEDSALIVEMTQRLAMEAGGEWGKSRVVLDVTLATAQDASFSATVARDGYDRSQKRRIAGSKITHRLTSGSLEWDLEAGAWEDTELDLSRVYGSTRLSAAGFFVEASRNRDAEYGLVLPSRDAASAAIRGWESRAGYNARPFGLEGGRTSAEGFPETLTGKGYVYLGRMRVEGEAQYDLDARIMADETVTVQVPGRCWAVEIGRSRNPDRTDWSLKLSLEI